MCQIIENKRKSEDSQGNKIDVGPIGCNAADTKVLENNISFSPEDGGSVSFETLVST
jgi:hypothetical protein